MSFRPWQMGVWKQHWVIPEEQLDYGIQVTFLWSFHNTASIIFWSFPFFPCAYKPFPPLPSLCKGEGKQGLIWRLNMLKSSRLVQARQSLCSFPTLWGTADRVTNPALEAGWVHFETIPLCLKEEKSLMSRALVLHGLPDPLIPLLGARQTLYELLGLKWALLQLVTCCVNKCQQGAPLMSPEDVNMGDVYGPWIM